MTTAPSPFVFDVEDCGRYVDGASGHQHLRVRLAMLLGLVQTPTEELIESLQGAPPDDCVDEYEALDYLQGVTSPLLLWRFEDGDLVLLRAEDIE